MVNKTEVERLYLEEGMTVKAIAPKLGIGEQTLHRRMASWAIPKRSRSEVSRKMWRDSFDKPEKPTAEMLRKLYLEDKLSTHAIARQFCVAQFTVLVWCKEYGIRTRSMSESLKLRGFIGSANPSWKGGRHRNKAGYIRVPMPDHYKGDKSKRVLEHILRWEESHGCPLPSGWVIHHINGIRDDNRIENLQALPSSTHAKVHHKALSQIDSLEIQVDRLLTKVIQLEVNLEILTSCFNLSSSFLTDDERGEVRKHMKQRIQEA